MQVKSYKQFWLFSLTTILVLVHSSLVTAENSNVEENMAECTKGSEMQMNVCMLREYRNADAKMNEIYEQLLNILKYPSGIEDSQSAWIKYRDTECSNEVFQLPKSGSIYPFQTHLCKKLLTEERLKRLDDHLKNDCNGCPSRK